MNPQEQLESIHYKHISLYIHWKFCNKVSIWEYILVRYKDGFVLSVLYELVSLIILYIEFLIV